MRIATVLVCLLAITAAHAAPEAVPPAYQVSDEEAVGEFDLRTEVTVPQAPAAPLLRVAYCWSNAGNTLLFELDAREARLVEVRAGRARTLVSAPAPSLTLGDHHLAIKRRELATRVLWDGVVLLTPAVPRQWPRHRRPRPHPR